MHSKHEVSFARRYIFIPAILDQFMVQEGICGREDEFFNHVAILI